MRHEGRGRPGQRGAHACRFVRWGHRARRHECPQRARHPPPPWVPSGHRSLRSDPKHRQEPPGTRTWRHPHRTRRASLGKAAPANRTCCPALACTVGFVSDATSCALLGTGRLESHHGILTSKVYILFLLSPAATAQDGRGEQENDVGAGRRSHALHHFYVLAFSVALSSKLCSSAPNCFCV